jgi:hypothetical protein
LDQAALVEARSLATEFEQQIRHEVRQGMQTGGPVFTIDICAARAPSIARRLSTQSGWRVSRTSLRLRNLGNSPDAWERRVLQQFETRRAAGEPVEQLEYAEFVRHGNARHLRYMKAIPTQRVCLQCHATEASPAVEEKLLRIYPADQARGFALGDIRGAITLSRPEAD